MVLTTGWAFIHFKQSTRKEGSAVSFAMASRRLRSKRSIWAVVAFPICNQMTLGGAPRSKLNSPKSASLLNMVYALVRANAQISASVDASRPTDVTWTEPGKRSAKRRTRLGERF